MDTHETQSTPDLAEVCGEVGRIVSKQGRILRDRRRAGLVIRYKDKPDILTDADLAVEHSLKADLKACFPGFGTDGEETGQEGGDGEYRWVIDPIDGTKYYAGFSGLFAVSVGLLRRGRPVVGVVLEASNDQLFHAFEGGGAFLGEKRLSGSDVERVEDVIVNVDTPGTDRLSRQERDWFERKLVRLTRKVYRVRALGICSLAACWAASGALDAYIDLTGYATPHDTAGATVILREAGLRTERLKVTCGPARLMAAPKPVWNPLRDMLLE